MVVETKQKATPATDAAFAELRAALDGGQGLYTAAHQLAESMDESTILRLWAERGGQFLYGLAQGRIGTERRMAGMPSGYSVEKEDYGRDRRAEVLSSYVGVLQDNHLRLRRMGELDIVGCQGAAANHENLASANTRQAEKFLELAAALEPGQTLGDLDPEVLLRIWFN
jgi:hypothetical protein